MKPKSQTTLAFAEKLRYLRQSSGMTQQELSAHLGLERSTYAYYETGSTEPSLDKLKRISEEFQVSLDDMIGIQYAAPNLARQSNTVFLSNEEFSSGARRIANYDKEERAFISILRHLDPQKRKDLYYYCLDLIQDKKRATTLSSLFNLENEEQEK